MVDTASPQRVRIGEIRALTGDERADLGFEPEGPGAAQRGQLERFGRRRVRRHARCGRVQPRSPRAAPRTRRARGRTRRRRCRCRPEARRRAARRAVRPRIPSSPFERGQWTTATSWRASIADLLRVDLDAVRRDDARIEQTRGREAPDPALPVRVDQQRLDRLHRPLAAKQPVELVLALVEVRHHRHAEGQAGCVHLGRARVGGVRRHADLHPVRESGSDVLGLLLELLHRLGRVAAEDLEVDDRAQAELGAGVRGRSGEGRVPDGRDPGREALRRRRAVRSPPSAAGRSAPSARCGLRATARTRARRRSRRRPRTRDVSGR